MRATRNRAGGRNALDRSDTGTDKEAASALWDWDKAAIGASAIRLGGVDEAGRGPLAGEVVAGFAMLDYGKPIPGIDDSKKLPGHRREALYDRILEGSLCFGIGSSDASEIDRLNILRASHLAMRRAVEAAGMRPDLLLVDGNMPIPDVPWRQRCVVKGDALSASIAAASILAKVWRDRRMAELDALYPQYGFAVHKGYCTRGHLEALRTYGPCPIHRRSFHPTSLLQTELFDE